MEEEVIIMQAQQPKSFIPDEEDDNEELSTPKSFIADEQEKKPDWTDKIKSALSPAEKIHPDENNLISKGIESGKKIWNKISEPLTEAPTKFAESVSQYINPERETKGLKGIGSAYVEGLGHAVSGLSSPLNLALTATGIGAAARIPGSIFATKALLAPIIAEGIQHTYKGIKSEDLPEILSGGLEAGLGVLGMRSGHSYSDVAAKEPAIRQPSQSRELPYRMGGSVQEENLTVPDSTVRQPDVKMAVSNFVKSNPDAKMKDIEKFIDNVKSSQISKPIEESTVRQPENLPPDFITSDEQDIFNKARAERVKKALQGESSRYTEEDLAKAKIEEERLLKTPAARGKKSFVNPFEKKTETITSESKPTAKYAYDWPEAGGKQYHIEGGPYNRSTVGEARLRELGIEIPESPTVSEELSGEQLGAKTLAKGEELIKSPEDIVGEKPKSFEPDASEEPIEMFGGFGGINPSKRELKPSSGPYGAALDKLFQSMGRISENRVQQDIINKVERTRRFAKFSEVEDVGVKGAAQSLSKLKGEFEKVDVEKLKMTQPQVDSLFTAVKRAKITEGEKARGYTTLFKLLNGEGVPQRNELAVLNEVFGNNFANRITEMHGGLGLAGMKLAKTANTMKAMMYSSDMSMGLRQGIGMIHKPEWRSAMREQFKYLAKPEYFEAAMQAIEEHPKYSIAKESGLFIAKPGGLLNGEEAYMDNYIGDIPKGVKGLYTRNIVEGSERAYIGGLNKLRFDLFNNLTTLADKLGQKPFATEMLKNAKGELMLDETTRKPKTVTVPTKTAEDIAKYINVFTGRGGLGELERIKGIMNFTFGSPRMISSRLTALNPKFYYDLDPFTRKEALKSLLAVAAASTTINTLGALAGGKVGLNVLSSDFMKTRFASNNVIDPSGSFQQPIVAAARMIGELNRMASRRKLAQGEQTIPQIAGNFLANKLSPITGLAYDLVSAKQFTGGGDYTDRFGNKKNIMSETSKRFVSIFSQDMYDLLKSDPSFAEAIGVPPLALFGAGEQNYPERKSVMKPMGKFQP